MVIFGSNRDPRMPIQSDLVQSHPSMKISLHIVIARLLPRRHFSPCNGRIHSSSSHPRRARRHHTFLGEHHVRARLGVDLVRRRRRQRLGHLAPRRRRAVIADVRVNARTGALVRLGTPHGPRGTPRGTPASASSAASASSDARGTRLATSSASSRRWRCPSRPRPSRCRPSRSRSRSRLRPPRRPPCSTCPAPTSRRTRPCCPWSSACSCSRSASCPDGTLPWSSPDLSSDDDDDALGGAVPAGRTGMGTGGGGGGGGSKAPSDSKPSSGPVEGAPGMFTPPTAGSPPAASPPVASSGRSQRHSWQSCPTLPNRSVSARSSVTRRSS